MNRWYAYPLSVFAGVLAIGSAAGLALGGDLRVSLGLWIVLVVTFACGLWVGREEHDAS
jgi:hypothetical protein